MRDNLSTLRGQSHPLTAVKQGAKTLWGELITDTLGPRFGHPDSLEYNILIFNSKFGPWSRATLAFHNAD